jgi:hypothetical protein
MRMLEEVRGIKSLVDLPCVFSCAEGLEEIDPRPRMQGSAAIDVCGK